MAGLESADETDGTILKSGEVILKGKGHQLYILHTGLRLLASDKQGKTSTAGPELDVTWRDVLCACEASATKSKSVQSADTASPDASPSRLFVVHYISRNLKTKKMTCRNITLESTQETADDWITRIEEKRKAGKPQKLLVIINPIGGSGTARQTFEKQVRPLFTVAGVELVVRVTERAKHAVEIVKTFDVKSIDGVVAMGGDGMYMEVLHALTLRKQEEEGVDFHNPDARLLPPTVPVGLLPAGTGNGVSSIMNGINDLVTATLVIIRGESVRMPIYSLHEPGKLITYFGLLLGFGYFARMIRRTDELRWMKRGRYPYAILASMFQKKKHLEFEVEVLKNAVEKGSGDGPKSDAAAATSSEWEKMGRRRFTTAGTVFWKLLDEEDEDGKLRMETCPSDFDFYFLRDSSAVDNFKFWISFNLRKKFEREWVEWHRNLLGMRLKLPDNAENNSDIEELSRSTDIDGELVLASVPQFEVRYHAHFLPFFCVPTITPGS